MSSTIGHRPFGLLHPEAQLHLERLMTSWNMLADLCFSDLLLFAPPEELAPVRPGKAIPATFVVVGQIRPTTSQTLLSPDLVGRVYVNDPPEVTLAWQHGIVATGQHRFNAVGRSLSFQAIPVRRKDAVLAVLCRVWSRVLGRRKGTLERVYLELFERFSTMVAAGVFPYATDDPAPDDSPRVGDGVMVLDSDARITFASPNAVSSLHRMGIVSAIVGADLASLGLETSALGEAFRSQLPASEEIERRPEIVAQLRCLPLIDSGAVTGAAVLIRDVTDLRRRDRLLLSKDATIREVHHRVKNNLQTISSVLRLQARRAGDSEARTVLLEAERRIQAIAVVHDILAGDIGEEVHLEDIVSALVAMALDADLSPTPVEIEVVGEAGDVPADIATPLALVIAELLLNAVEHAFPAPRVGSGQVRLRLRNDGGTLAVDVRDNGVGLSPGFDVDQTKSLGLSIVRDLVRSQLGGTIVMRTAEVVEDEVAGEDVLAPGPGPGTLVRIVLPLERRD